ncbi:MAG: SMR family transporter [Paracoccus sp. (in: a-proteobacteria)]|nr:SMR family transporter [Paracoccus sp. (in: a-proteobacteria)]
MVSRLGYSLVTLSHGGSFWRLARVMTVLPPGAAYVIWAAIGSAGAFLVGVAILGESTSPMRIAADLGGIVRIKLGS